MQDNCLLYPVYKSELGNLLDENENYPVYQSEIGSVGLKGNVLENEIPVCSTSSADEEEIEIPGFVNNWVEIFSDMLQRNHIVMEAVSNYAISKLFLQAISNGDLEESSDATEQIKEFVLKLEFQLMLKGAGNENIATETDINQLAKDLYGNNLEINNIIKEKKKVNVVASVSSEINSSENLSTIRFKEDILKVHSPMKTDEVSIPLSDCSKKEAATGASDKLSVLDALKKSGKYPTKKDEQKNEIPDMFVIGKAENAIFEDDRVLFAYYSFVTFCDSNKLKSGKNGLLKLPFLDNSFRVFVVTGRFIILSSSLTSEKDAIVIPKNDVIKIEHVYEKKIGSLGQTQITLANGKTIVVTIDRLYKMSEDQEYEIFISMMNKVIPVNTEINTSLQGDEEDSFEKSIIERRKIIAEFSQIIIDPDQYESQKCSIVDRLVASELLDVLVELYDDYLNSEEKEPALLLIQEGCIQKRVNNLLVENVFPETDMDEWRNSMEIPEDTFEALKAIENQFGELLDEMVDKCRAECVKKLKNQ